MSDNTDSIGECIERYTTKLDEATKELESLKRVQDGAWPDARYIGIVKTLNGLRDCVKELGDLVTLVEDAHRRQKIQMKQMN